MKLLGTFIRQKREALLKENRSFSQLQVSRRIGIEQSYLSKIERGVATKLSEEKIVALAEVLGEDPDYLLALGGKVSEDVLTIIKQRPRLFSRLVRDMKHISEDVIEADHDFKQRQSRMNRIYDLAAIGFFHMENDPDRSAWSSNMTRILHLPRDVAPCMAALEAALEQSSRERFAVLERESFASRKTFNCELRLADQGAGPVFIRVWGDYDVLSGDSGTARLGLIQDVTKEVLFREELSRAHQALSGTVERQSEQVAQGIEELKSEIAARRELEAELRAINEEIAQEKCAQRIYLKQSAFELRSLVNRLFVEKGSLHDEALSGTLSQISAAINNMNDFFGIKDGIVPLPVAFDPRASFESLIEDIRLTNSEGRAALQLVLSPNLPDRIVVDPQRVLQITHSVAWFLLGTTPWGSIQLIVDHLRERDLLSLALSSPATTGAVTTDFFYPHSPTGAQEPSWRLSTVGPIVRALGGSLDLKLTPGGGTMISILIPSKPVPEVQHENVDARLPVLVVDDDEYSRLYAERIIRKSGYEAEAVALGQEALARLEAKRYGLVLLDIQLPDMDGVAVARSVRGAGAINAGTAIIAVTAHATPEHRRLYEAVGIDQFIAKPFKIETLKKMLDSCLSG